MDFLQDTRMVQLTTPLGGNVLMLQALHGQEELGRPFGYELSLVSQDAEIDLNQLLGKPMTLTLQQFDGSPRYFNGLVTRCVQTSGHGQFAGYTVMLRPWFWMLTRTSDCRIFQHLTIPQIIKQVFRDLGFSDFEDALSGQYREWEYCVQYRETSFQFISRLMEQEGIYYYFRHEKDRHVLILADAYGAHTQAAGYASVPYFPPDQQQRERDHIYDWKLAKQVQPGSLELNDYDFQRPSARIDVRSAMPRPHTAGDYPLYDYPGAYVQSQDGEHYARTHLESLQSQHEQIEMVGNARGLGSGNLFSMTGFERQDQNREYLIVGANYVITQELYESGGGGGTTQFTGSFTCIDGQQSYRAAIITHKPVVTGPQTALVVGPSGEEIWTDQYGRIKVHFYWDRHDKSNENSSCWIRVSQSWAGKNWGSIQIPRIGQEVIVSFLEGDPDRPIVTGRVYNAEQTVPYDLPANATQSGTKSRSSKGGSPANYNEIRMEDRKGAEHLLIHAEKDQSIEVEHNEVHWVGNDRVKVVDHDQTTTIGNNAVRAVKVSDHLLVGGAKRDSVGTGYVIEAGQQIRLVCGESVLELNASGQINILGTGFNIVVSGAGQIETGGRLDLNAGTQALADKQEDGNKSTIDAAVKAYFPDRPKS